MILKPAITIGITCYCEGDWLLECWKSVLAQTDERWNAVLVMDKTNHHRTREIYEQLVHPKLLKYEMPENMGPYPTRNKAFELTDTPYHFYLDGDDQLLPDSVALVLDVFAKPPEARFGYGDYRSFGHSHLIRRFLSSVTSDDFIEVQPTPGPCAYKKQLWEYLRGFALELAHGNGDYDFLIGAAEAGIKGYHCGDVFYRYRVGHASKVSNSYRQQYHKTHEIIVQRHPKFFSSPRNRNRFLALGYKFAALSNSSMGDKKKASTLAISAIRFGMWNDYELWSLVFECIFPSFGARLFRRIKRLVQSTPNVLHK